MSELFQQQPLVLASASPNRLKLLSHSGLKFITHPSMLDETAIKNAFKGSELTDLAHQLAYLKAQEVSHHYPHHTIIGVDQLCTLNNQIFDKPKTHEVAIQHLKTLQGTRHELITAITLIKENHVLWQYHEISSLTMRPLTDAFIEAYLHLEKPYQSCGAYHFESAGKWLFSEVLGHEDTIIGLPLIALINALLDHGLVKLTNKT